VKPPRLIIFDLDGTLVDSSRDISGAMNAALARLGLGPRAPAELISYVGDGIPKLVERGLGAALERRPLDAELAEALKIYRAEYDARLLDHTRPYPGIPEALERIRSISMAVVSNKPTDLSERVLTGLNLRVYFSRVLGGDATARRKPDPEPLLLVAAGLGVEPAAAAMVGDSCNDMRAGRAAGMATIGCAWGFGGAAGLAGCQPDQVLASPLQIPLVLGIT